MRQINKLTAATGIFCLLVTVASCAGHRQSARSSATTSYSPSSSATPLSSSATSSPSPTSSVLPELTANDSKIHCPNGTGFLMWQGQYDWQGVTLRIADLQCEDGTAPKFGQVIETFILTNGSWVSQGLASGPDLAFRTIGQCLDDLVNKTSCPAQILSEAGGQIDGTLLITATRRHTTWSFTAN
jgi:hypothetical protein